MYRLAIAVLVICLIGACSRQRPKDSTKVDDIRLVEVNVTATGGALAWDGQVAPSARVLTVLDHEGQQLTFDEELVLDAEADRDVLAFPEESHSLTMVLFEGHRYDFTVWAHDSEANLISYGEAHRTTVSSGSNAVMADLRAVMGNSHLHTRLPVSKLLPGQQLDLMFTVTANNRQDLVVSASDYTATYEVSNGASLLFSNRGLRIRAGDATGGPVVVTGTASGLVPERTDATLGELQVSLQLPFSSDLHMDLEVPTITTLAFDSAQQILTGIVDDNFGIASVNAFDGSVLLASTDEVGAQPAIVFPGGGTAFVTHLSLPTGSYGLTVVAADTSGNEAHSQFHVSVP